MGLGFSGAAAGVEGVLAGVSRVTKELNTQLVAPGETRMSKYCAIKFDDKMTRIPNSL